MDTVISQPEYEALLKEITILRDENSFLKDQLEQLKRMVFGQKRERFIPGDNGQSSLFDAEINITPESEIIRYERTKKTTKKQSPHFRNPIPSHIPRKEIVIEPEGIDTSGLKRIGEEVTEELEYEEAKFYVNKYIRPKYVSESGEGVFIAQLPSRVIIKGIAGPGLISHILISKFIDHLPIYRIRKQFKRSGIDLAESTMNDWVSAAVELLEPLYNVQKAHILGRDYIMVDETTIRVLDKQKKGKTHTGYHWVYLDPLEGEVFFEYKPGRHARFPRETLKDFEGYLQSDGYTGYNETGRREGIVHLACFAHARRKFEQALSNDRKRARWMLKRIRYLYLVERRARELALSYEDRHEFRQRHSTRQLKRIKEWLIKNKQEVLPKSSMGTAIDYTLNLWSRLIRYLEDGRLEIDNNRVENAIRPVAIGRKNYLFAGSHNGAKRAAILYSLLSTAQLQGHDPKAYLKDVLSRIADHQMNRLDELLPASWKAPLKVTSAA